MRGLNLIGATAGKFKIISELGRGGMGIVYLARQSYPERMVALKVLLPAFLQDASYRQRFRHEADSAARLEHPHIVPIYEVGELTIAGETMALPYIAMRYIEGRTLRDELDANGAMSVVQATSLLTPVGDALDYAHQHGMIHRDLKPSNILLSKNGFVYLTDFGLARDIQNSAPGLTATGTIIGTPEYMSPEQAQGSPILTPASDIYALGLVMYEVLTGKLPFHGESPMSVAVARLIHQPVPPRDIRGDLSVSVEDVLMRALARNPASRYDSAKQLLEDLRGAVANTQGAAAQPASPPLHQVPTVVTQLPQAGPVPAASPGTSGVPQQPLQTGPGAGQPPSAGSYQGQSSVRQAQGGSRGSSWLLFLAGAAALLLLCGGGLLLSQGLFTGSAGVATGATVTTAPAATDRPTTPPNQSPQTTGVVAPPAANVGATASVSSPLVSASPASPAPAATTTLPRSAPQIRLSQATLVAIYRGQITTWNDERLQADNPGVALPDLPITVFYRSDASGTTRTFTEYLVQIDPWWRDNLGAAYRLGDAGSSPWPVGTGVDGSSNLAELVRDTPGAIGYAAPSFAERFSLPLATLQNSAGNWVTPSMSTIGDAANQTVDQLDERLRGFIVNGPGPNDYPLSLYTWIITCPAELSVEQQQALTDFLYWAVSDPQAIATARRLGYETLPPVVRAQIVDQFQRLLVDGQPVFTGPVSGEAFKPRGFSAPVALNGSGATFPEPLYQELIVQYERVAPAVSLTYIAQGSTRGRRDLLQAGTVQFAGTDEPVADGDIEITRANCSPAPLHVPTAVGAVALFYNLPPVP